MGLGTRDRCTHKVRQMSGSMAYLFRDVGAASNYKDRMYKGDWNKALATSTTLYVGNLSFFTTEEQIMELFSLAGDVKRIIMGLDRVKKTPCGFCFVEYFTRRDAETAMSSINGCKALDSRIIRCDWDSGFTEGRQFGRGRAGGQVRDEHRPDFDPARGGWGRVTAMDHAGPAGHPGEGGRFGEEGGPGEGTWGGGGKRRRSDDPKPPGAAGVPNPRFRGEAEPDDED